MLVLFFSLETLNSIPSQSVPALPKAAATKLLKSDAPMLRAATSFLQNYIFGVWVENYNYSTNIFIWIIY